MDRFWAKVEKTDSCWIWNAGKNGNGYGAFKSSGKQHPAHRFSYELANGPIPEGMVVRHSCDTPLCVRPDHLSLGSPADNTRDMLSRGRNGQQKKTHCKWGHPFEDANIYWHQGHRTCRECQRRRWIKTNERRRKRAS